MIFEQKISFFKSVKDTGYPGTTTIVEALMWIKTGKFKKEVDKIRSGSHETKKTIPAIAFHGLFEKQRRKNNFYEASGLVIIDIDDVKGKIDEIKTEIVESSDHVVAAMTSPSGNGIKVLYYVQPEIVTQESYRSIGREISKNYSGYGSVDYLSVTDCLIVTHDPQIKINRDAYPDFIYVAHEENETAELEPIDTDATLWDDPEDFFDTVLVNSITEKTNNNFHFIQVSLIDLAKFGFTHPEYDLSFVVDYSEGIFGSSSKNKQRFIEAAVVAKKYPQRKHPYKIIEGDYDDEYVDYSEWVEPDDKKPEEGKKKKENDDEDENKVVKYGDIFDSVLTVIAEGDRVGFETSLKNFADIFRFRGSGVLTITGIPGHGKTEFIDSVLIDLARLYDHHTVFVGFEQTVQEHLIKLMRKVAGADITCPSFFKNKENEPVIKKLYNDVTENFNHIDTIKTGGNLNVILETTAKLIKRKRDTGKDVKYVVIDPFNMLSLKGRFSNLEKIEEMLRRITHFSHKMNVLVFLVAHPFKMKKDDKTGKYEVPDFYSVKGTSAFFEMSYHGLVVYRTGYQPNDLMFVRVLKVKQNNLGITGEQAYFIYEKNSGRYIPVDEEGNELSGDHREKFWNMKK